MKNKLTITVDHNDKVLVYIGGKEVVGWTSITFNKDVETPSTININYVASKVEVKG